MLLPLHTWFSPTSNFILLKKNSQLALFSSESVREFSFCFLTPPSYFFFLSSKKMLPTYVPTFYLKKKKNFKVIAMKIEV